MLPTISDVIAESISLYQKNWRTFVRYSVLSLIPALIVVISANIFTPEIIDGGQLQTVGPKLLAHVIISFISGTVGFLISIAFLLTLKRAYFGEAATDMRSSFREALPLFIPGAIVSFLVGTIFLLGLLLLLIPGIYAVILLAFALYEIVFEKKAIIESLKSSAALVRGRWWGVFSRLAVPIFVFLVAISILQWALALPFLATSGVVKGLGTSIAKMIVSIFATPLTSAVPVILYFALKKNPTPTKTTVADLAP